MNDDVLDIELNFEANPDNIRDLKEKIAELAVETSKVGKKSKVDTGQIDKLSEAINKSLSDLDSLEAKFNEVKNTDVVSNLVDQFNAADSKVKTLSEELSSLPTPNFEEMNKEYEALVSNSEIEYNKLNEKIKESNALLEDSTSKLRSLESSMDEYIKSGTTAPKELKREVQETARAVQNLKNQIAGYIAEQKNIQAGVDAFKDDYNSLVDQRNALREQISYWEKQRDEIGRVLDSDEEVAKKENERAGQLDEITKKYNEQYKELYKQEEELARILKMEWTKGYKGNTPKEDPVDMAKPARERSEEIKKSTEYEKERVAELQKAIRLHQEDMKQAKAATSQYYYRLRSMKMLNRYLQMANTAMNNFGKKALTSFATLGKKIGETTKKLKPFNAGLKKASTGVKKHTSEVKRASKAHDTFNISLAKGLKTFLKYTFGIRSLYVLFNRLRGAMSDGMEVMATQYGSVNNTMSSIVTSLNQIKNAIATIVQPIAVLVAPMLARLAEMISQVTVKIASFFAAFTGQSIVYKAIRVNKQYIDSIKKQQKALKDLNKEQLAHYDMLNVIDQKKEDEADEDISDVIGFDEVKIDPDNKIVDFINKIKDLIKQLLQPLIDAWNKWKDKIIEALKKLWAAIKQFVKDFIRDFLQVWKEFAQQIAENILAIIKNIIDFLRILIEKIDEAWNHARNGYRILRAIFKIIERITWYIRKMTDYLVKWAEKLNLIPLFTAIADTLEQEVVPAVEKIMRAIYEVIWMGFLEIVRWLLEEAGPKIVDIWGDIWEIVGNIIDNVRKALSNGDDEFNEYDRLYRILQSIEGILDIIIDGIKLCTEATKEWSKSLDFEPLFYSIERVLEEYIKPAIGKIVSLLVGLYTEVVLPMLTWVIEDALPQVVTIIGNIVAAVGNIAEGIEKALKENDNLKAIVEGVQTILTGILNLIEWCAVNTKIWAQNVDFAPYIESIRQLLEDIKPLIEFIAVSVGLFYRDVVLPFIQYLIEEGLPKLHQKIGEVIQAVDWDHLTTKVQEFLDAFEPFLEKVWETLIIILGDLGDAIAKFVNSDTFDHLVDTLIKWMNEADPDKMAKGIEQLVIKFIALKAALSFGTILGSFKEMIMTLINFGNNKALARNIAKNTEAINKLKGGDTPDEKKGGIAGLLGMLKKLVPESSGALTKLQKFGGVTSIAGGGILSLTGLLDGLTNGFSLSEIAATGVGDALIGLGLVMLGVVSGPVGAAVALAIFAVEQMIIGIHERMTKFGESFPEAIEGMFDSITKGVEWLFEHLGEIVGKLIGKLIQYIIKTWSDFVASYDGDFLQLGIDILKGIFKIFMFPMELVIAAVKAFFKGLVEGFRDAFDMHSPSRHPEIVQLGVDILYGILGGIANAMLGFPLWLWNNVFVPMKDAFVEKAKEIWGDLKEAGAGFIENLKQGAESKYNNIKESITGLWSDIKEGVGTWWSEITQDISDRWEDIKSAASEKFEDIRSTIEDKWSEAKENASTLWEEITGDLGTWWDEIKSDAETKFEDIRSGIENKWSGAKENASNLWEEITDNLRSFWDDISSNASEKFEDIRSKIEDKWLEVKDNINSIWQDISSDLQEWWSNLLGNAHDKFEDIRGGIADKWEEVKSNTSDIWDDVKDTVGDKVEALKDHRDKMEDAGNNLIDGLKEGLENRMHSALDTVRDIAGQIADAARDAFGIHSPSRVFAEIGRMVTAGLVEGIDEDSDGAEDAIYSLVPGLEVFDRLYDVIVSKLSTLRQDAVLIVDSMIDEISASMSKLDNLDVLGSTISKLNNIDIPDIAAGKVVSPQIEMLINKDNSKLEKLLEDILDKLDEFPDNPGDNNSNNPNVVLQLDRTVLAEAVWDETEKRYKQTGKRPVFA